MTFRWITALAAAALLLAACGGGDTDRTKARLRLVNASDAYAALDLRVDGELRQGGVGYGTRADYVEVDPDEADSTITNAGSATALLSFTPDIARDKSYTVLAYGAQGALRQMLIDDNVGAPDSGRTLLRIVNAGADAGDLDVYLTGADEALSTAVPVQSRASFGVATGPLTVDSGNWRLRVTATGSKTDLRLDVSALALASEQVVTLVLAPAQGGVLMNALLLTQRAAIERRDTTLARVRVAAGVAASGAVSARVGERRVALVTGEEKRVPARPAYWVSTVEAMPRDVDVSFLAKRLRASESKTDYGGLGTECQGPRWGSWRSLAIRRSWLVREPPHWRCRVARASRSLWALRISAASIASLGRAVRYSRMSILFIRREGPPSGRSHEP